jgi:hypothetical protein
MHSHTIEPPRHPVSSSTLSYSMQIALARDWDNEKFNGLLNSQTKICIIVLATDGKENKIRVIHPSAK